MARTAAMLAALLAAWPARGAGAVRACSGGRSGRPVLRLRGGVGRHRGVQTEAAEFCKEDQVNTCPREHGRAAPAAGPGRWRGGPDVGVNARTRTAGDAQPVCGAQFPKKGVAGGDQRV